MSAADGAGAEGVGRQAGNGHEHLAVRRCDGHRVDEGRDTERGLGAVAEVEHDVAAGQGRLYGGGRGRGAALQVGQDSDSRPAGAWWQEQVQPQRQDALHGVGAGPDDDGVRHVEITPDGGGSVPACSKLVTISSNSASSRA